MPRVSTHILDMVRGRPAAGVRVALRFGGEMVAEIASNADGRAVLLEAEALRTGVYELVFWVGAYFRAQGDALPEPAFLDEVAIRFGVADAAGNYHVPLLAAPYGYSTYRGS